MKDNKLHAEVSTMRVSLVLSILYLVSDIIIAIVCDSETILLDGLYGVADVVVSLMAIFVILKLKEPPNERYQFGYAKFEPFMTAIEGILIGAICFSTIAMSIQDIAHPDPVNHPNLIIWYSFINIFIGFGFGFYSKAVGKKSGSEIIKTHSELWMLGGFISFAVFIAFYLSGFMTRMGFTWYADYVDPVMAILLSLFFLQRPYQIIRDAFFDLVDASPGKEIKTEVQKVVSSCINKYHLPPVKWLKLRKAGRKIFVFVCLTMDSNKNLKEITGIREGLLAEIDRINPDLEVYVFFDT